MISSGLNGGLGNYLFQIAVAEAMAIENNDVAIFDFDKAIKGHNKIDSYTQNIFRNIKKGEVTIDKIYVEKKFTYDKINYQNNLFLNGYFQSEKYFYSITDKIKKIFSIDKESMNYINDKYNKINFDSCTSLHVRRGDYLNYPNHHPISSIEYYKKAIQILKPNKILIFSDDIQWCKNNMSKLFDDVLYIYDNPDYIDLWLMSLCKNNIIANSTFSWWGAWLNNNLNKKVVAPSKWFGNLNNFDTKDLFPVKWIVI